MTDLDKFIAECEGRLDAATPGPWYGENGDYKGGYAIEGIAKQNKVDVVVNCDLYDCEPGVQRIEDSRFIANAPTDLRKALRIIKVAREALQFYASAADNDVLGEPNTDPYLMPVKLGTRAREARAKIDEIAGGEG